MRELERWCHMWQLQVNLYKTCGANNVPCDGYSFNKADRFGLATSLKLRPTEKFIVVVIYIIITEAVSRNMGLV